MAKYKLGLIFPKTVLSNDPEFLEFGKTSLNSQLKHGYSGFSAGLLVIAALTPESFEITMIDENVEPIDFNREYDLVGITGMTQQATRAYEIADGFKEKGITVVMGGIHATVLPEEVKTHVDSVVVGEAEETWPKFINDFLKKKIKPFYRQTEPVDLTKSPIPRYDLLKPENYKPIWIQTTRGCPHDCEFCAASKVYGFKFRHKSVEQVITEITRAKEVWGNARINFADDNIFVNRKFARELVKKLKPLDIKWFAFTDISIAKDEELLELIKVSGCETVFIGFESISEQGLSSISKWKLKQLKEYPISIEKIQSKGIAVIGTFIIGFDTDDVSIFKTTGDFIIENNLAAPPVSILTPFPGTVTRNKLEKQGRLLSNSWGNYTFSNVNFVPERMSSQQLRDGVFELYKRVYSREVQLKRAKYFKNVYSKLME